VPSGLFVPCLLIGAALGRFIGHVAKIALPHSDFEPGAFAVFGAGAMLSSVTRLTITIVVILFEVCDRSSLVVPLMFCCVFSKILADRFGIGVYDIHIELKNVPFVEAKPSHNVEQGNAEDLMSPNKVNVDTLTKAPRTELIVLKEVETHKNILKILETTKHNGFPIVSNEGKFRGLIRRKGLIVILHHLEITKVADSQAHAQTQVDYMSFANHP